MKSACDYGINKKGKSCKNHAFIIGLIFESYGL